MALPLLLLLAMAACAAAYHATVTVQYDNGSTAEMFDANFAQFSPSISASHLVMRYVGAGCPGDTPLPAVNYNWVGLVVRGNCTFVQKFAAVSNQGASAMLVINDEHGGELRMAGYVFPDATTPSVSVTYEAGQRLLELLRTAANATLGIQPGHAHDDEEDPESVPLYTRTAIFAVLCILIVFILSIYCQGSLRLLMRRHHPRGNDRRAGMLTAMSGNSLVHAERQRELARVALAKMPCVSYQPCTEEGDVDVATSAVSCAICLDDFEVDEQVRVLPCQHFFHTTCVDPWLLNGTHTCPLCKRNVIEPAPTDDSTDGRRVAWGPRQSEPEIAESVAGADSTETQSVPFVAEPAAPAADAAAARQASS